MGRVRGFLYKVMWREWRQMVSGCLCSGSRARNNIKKVWAGVCAICFGSRWLERSKRKRVWVGLCAICFGSCLFERSKRKREWVGEDFYFFEERYAVGCCVVRLVGLSLH